ncbi:hypothetical protein Cgig2_017242 [Carnegiea gigantea]|uniref:Transcription termination and cleavage factor C-terminal domain-containing protein n=1 Tax=Carnegiea gigantea TaxID=171969 RepID=A0A9Q1GUG2_9CARY|nr:hypothetical protein Cgig2_017242 [Carnegiea gigantea]
MWESGFRRALAGGGDTVVVDRRCRLRVGGRWWWLLLGGGVTAGSKGLGFLRKEVQKGTAKKNLTKGTRDKLGRRKEGGGSLDKGPKRIPCLICRVSCPTQMGGSHLGTDFSNQGGTIAQMERGSPWPPVSRENTGGPPPPGPLPLGAGQMPLGNQPARVAPLTPEAEQALLQQVMSLTPDQINGLPPEQRQQSSYEVEGRA